MTYHRDTNTSNTTCQLRNPEPDARRLADARWRRICTAQHEAQWGLLWNKSPSGALRAVECTACSHGPVPQRILLQRAQWRRRDSRVDDDAAAAGCAVRWGLGVRVGRDSLYFCDPPGECGGGRQRLPPVHNIHPYFMALHGSRHSDSECKQLHEIPMLQASTSFNRLKIIYAMAQ